MSFFSSKQIPSSSCTCQVPPVATMELVRTQELKDWKNPSTYMPSNPFLNNVRVQEERTREIRKGLILPSWPPPSVKAWCLLDKDVSCTPSRKQGKVQRTGAVMEADA